MREYSGSPSCWMTKRESFISPLPPMRSRSVFQLCRKADLKHEIKSPGAEASADKVECSGPPTMLSAHHPRLS